MSKPKTVRLIFPPQLRKDGKPRKRQRNIYVSLNGRMLAIRPGIAVEAPEWVAEVCKHAAFKRPLRGQPDCNAAYECFVSVRTPVNCD